MSAISDTRRRFRTAASGGGWLSRLFKRPVPSPLPADFCGTKEQAERLVRRGLVVWGAVAQANMLLYSHGTSDAPANIVAARDFTFDDRPEDLVDIAHAIFQLKGTIPDDADLTEMAQTITDEGNALLTRGHSRRSVLPFAD